MTIYHPNVDLVNDNVYTIFGLILSIHSQDIEQELNSDVNSNSVLNLRKMTIFSPHIDIVNDNVHTKFGLNKSIRS